MKINVRYIPTDIKYEYGPEYSGFVLRRYDANRHRMNSVLLTGACLWTIDRLQTVLDFYTGKAL